MMRMCANVMLVRSHKEYCMEDFLESLSFAKEFGYQLIDFDFNTPILTDPMWEKNMNACFEAIDREGLSVRYTHLPFDYPKAKDPELWERFNLATERAMDLTAKAGAFSTAIHPNSSMTTDYHPEEEHRKCIAFLRPYAEMADRKNVRLALENMRGPGQSAPQKIRRYAMDYREVIRLADELGIGICWDTGHAYISMQDPAEAIEAIGKRLLMIHADDNFGEGDVHLVPFLGKVDWNTTIRALKKAGFEGDMYLEVGGNFLPEAMKRPYVASIAGACRSLVEMFDNA